MAVYKDEVRNTWYCKFYYEDWQGERKQKKKRGFRTKKDASEWEASFKQTQSADMDMTLSSFIVTYFEDKTGELKERTLVNKEHMLRTHIIPYFGSKKMTEI